MDAASINQLDDRDFRELITDNIHSADDNVDIWEQLLSGDLLARTNSQLLELRRETERALTKRRRDLEAYRAECFLDGRAGRQNYFAAKAEFEDWKRRANSFRLMVESRQMQAKARTKGSNEEWEQVNRGVRAALANLAHAVQRHQAAHAKSGSRTEQCDHDLWQQLDDLGFPFRDGTTASLRHMLTTTWSAFESGTGASVRATERLMRDAPAGRSARFEGAPKARNLGSGKLLASPEDP